MKNLSNSLFVECANVAEMRELSNYAKQFPLGGLQPKAIVATSGVKHYYVIIDESYREKAVAWLKKHVKLVWSDLRSEDSYGFDELNSRTRMARFVQQLVRDTIGDESLGLTVRPTIRSIKTAENDFGTCA